MLNPGSERNLISICIQRPDKIIDIVDEDITTEHFSVPANRYIFMAIMYLYNKSIKPSPLAIYEVLSTDQARNSVDELGGLEYIMILEEAYTTVENLKIFIDKVKQSYTRRKLVEIAQETHEFAMSDKAEILNPFELISHIESKLSELNTETSNVKEIYKMGDDTEKVLEARAENPQSVPGIETGWVQFDRYTGGGRPGDLIVITAPSKTGKSVVLTNWATKMAIVDQIPIVYFDTEMNEREQEDRILANLTGIPHDEICSGMYALDTVNGKAIDKLAKLKDARDKMKMGHYYHIFMPQFSIDKVMAIAKRFVLQMGVKAIFFDYIKIPSSSANFKSQQEYQALGYFTSGLKELAGMLGVPIFSAAQTNRDELETDSPDASNIGGSYRILQLASKLIFLYNKSDAKIAREGIERGNQQMFIKYQRNGQSDCPPINIMFDKVILRQTEC